MCCSFIYHLQLFLFKTHGKHVFSAGFSELKRKVLIYLIVKNIIQQGFISSVAEVNCYCTMADANHPQQIRYHVVVRLEHYILVFSGRYGKYANSTAVPRNMIWMYNLYTEQWSKQMIPESELCPPNTACASAVSIKEYVLLFGGYIFEQGDFCNELWKLSKSSEGLFTWCKVIPENTKEPSPRCEHSGWTHAQKLWIFAGKGPPAGDDLNDNGKFLLLRNNTHCNNQLFCFNPFSEEWTNPKCCGSIPSPRLSHASTIIGNTVWLYGGWGSNGIPLDELYELNIWTHVQTGNPKPQGRSACSLNVITQDQLLLHGGATPNKKTLSDTWILDLPSRTWKQYKSGDYPRHWHIGSTGLNNNCIIIGGSQFPVDSNDNLQAMFHIMLGPRSLQQLAVQTIYRHRNSLPIECLPKKLITLLGISSD